MAVAEMIKGFVEIRKYEQYTGIGGLDPSIDA
jgi:hypothetical protein